MTTPPYDTIDRAILHHLQENARKSITEIAEALNVADNTVRNRIEKLENDGVIRGYRVHIDYDQINVQHYYLFSCTARVSERERLAEKARQRDGIVEVITLMTGRENMLILAVGSEKDEMTDLASELDELGLSIEREHLIREHMRQPYVGFALENNI